MIRSGEVRRIRRAHVGFLPEPEQSQRLSNQLAFLAHTSPAVPLRKDFPGGQPYFLLDDLWKAFDEPSAFGCEIPLVLKSDEGASNEVTQCYVPYLSALQLFDYDTRCPHTRGLDDGSDEDLWQESASTEGTSLDCYGSSSSTTGSDEDKGATPLGRNSERHRIPRRRLLFEFHETACPHTREPLMDHVQRLGVPGGLRSCDLHPHSWLAVAWYPLYRIPAGRGLRELSACFLTFHSLTVPPPAPPPQRHWHLPGRVPLHPKRAALPFKADGGDMGADVPLPDPAIASRLGPVLEERRKAAGRMLPPAALTFLAPFGFIPYKAQARTWLDNEYRYASMVTAALTWNQRMGCKHPDLDFFARCL